MINAAGGTRRDPIGSRYAGVTVGVVGLSGRRHLLALLHAPRCVSIIQVSLGCMTFHTRSFITRGSRCRWVTFLTSCTVFFLCVLVCVCVRVFSPSSCFIFLLFVFPCGFSPPCRTPACQLPLLVGCPSLCRPSPGSRQVARLPTRQENSQSCRTLRGSSDR